MSEVVLPGPVKATFDPRLGDSSKWEEGTIDSFAPGAFAFAKQSRADKPELGEWDVIWFSCPCGCKSLSCLAIGEGHKPNNEVIGRPTWEWDGNREAPTLAPSIHHIDHWHGYLRNGEFIQA